MITNKTLIVIAGPTAVGKTTTAIEVAKYFNTEIVNADSRQFYKEMTIGTAVPSTEELNAVRHHLIKSHSVTEAISAGLYEKIALPILSKLFETKNTVVLTGGSGLFIDALVNGIDDSLPQANAELRKKLEALSLVEIQSMLQQVDPEYYLVVDKQNPHRLIRAIEVFELTGIPYSKQRKSKPKERPFKTIKVCLNRNREELYNRINQRVDIMIEAGLVAEVKSLEEHKNLKSLNTVGYQEIFEYLNGNICLERAIELIKQNSRRYAKRQLTWFRRDKNYKWFNEFNSTQVIEHIQYQLADQ